MDAIGLLKLDHAAVRRLFSRYEALGRDAHTQKKHLVQRITRELSVHVAIEEQFLYPYARARSTDLAAEVAQSLEEHSVGKWILFSLERHGPDELRFDAKMAVLIHNIRHHMREEEETLFPRLRSLCTSAELRALGDALRSGRKFAPTHPHPRLPDHPPANTIAGPVVGVVDRGRDFAEGTRVRWRDLIDRATARGAEMTGLNGAEERSGRKTVQASAAKAKRRAKSHERH